VNSLSGPVGGVIAQVSSAGGYIAVPGLTFYHSTKWALEGFTESLQKELDPDWQIRCVIFEPGGVKTKWWKENKKAFPRYPAYVREEGKKLGTEVIASMPAEVQNALSADSGDVANLMVKVVKDEDGMWGGRRLLRLPVGADAWILVKNDVQETRTNLEKWKNVSESTSPAGAKDALKAIGLLEG
jgi:NAD(P)-dependent dehydrogenase (short-subunit alcohol dehydrogenase family)